MRSPIRTIGKSGEELRKKRLQLKCWRILAAAGQRYGADALSQSAQPPASPNPGRNQRWQNCGRAP